LYIPAQLRRRALFLAEYQTYPEKSRFLTLEQRYFSRNNHQAIQSQHTFLHILHKLHGKADLITIKSLKLLKFWPSAFLFSVKSATIPYNLKLYFFGFHLQNSIGF